MEDNDFKFSPLSDEKTKKLIVEFHALMAKYSPDSVSDGVLMMTYALRETILIYKEQGVLTQEALPFFARALEIKDPEDVPWEFQN